MCTHQASVKISVAQLEIINELMWTLNEWWKTQAFKVLPLTDGVTKTIMHARVEWWVNVGEIDDQKIIVKH